MERYNPVEDEAKVLDFWSENKIRQKAVGKNADGKPFYFLDGPPYTSGKIHLGTAWNKSLKDMVTRYKRMRGYDVWDKAGYDMHGLPTEGKVQAKLGMKTKEDIEKYGLARFIGECRDFAVTNLKQMNADFKRLGVWLDFDNAYQTITNEYIEGTWWLVKRAHEKNRLYEGQMTMTWCGSCQTSLAKHELEYKEVKDKSIYVKFKVKGKDEYLVIWTTTPWTIAFNLGIMVNPTFTYVKAKVEDEIWIMAKDLADRVMEISGKRHKIIDEMIGKDLVGTEYEHPFQAELKVHFDDIRKRAKRLHVVVPSEEYVTLDYGTGLVHMAPGCGPEDYEVGHAQGIPPFSQVDEAGYYDDTMGPFAKKHAKEDNEFFAKYLEDKGVVAARETIKHDYAHCWRCKNPVIYRTTRQWFFRVEDLIPKMRQLNREKIYWVPDWAGNSQFDSWLENLRDNGITRQRFWGSPLPVWKCGSCQDYLVIESREDMKKNGASHIPEDLHKPWIDDVTIPCKRCKVQMKRIPDVMDVWIDAGVDSWASLDFPKDDKMFKRLFPADFITEGKDQIRGWFNLLFVASMLALEDISFKACYMTGFINDSYGRKMSKSLGNVISPEEVTGKYGSDTFRYYSIGAAAPGLDLNYNLEDVEIKRRNLNILWNLHNFVIDLAKTIGTNPAEHEICIKEIGNEERYILSKLNSVIKRATESLDSYNLNLVPGIVEELFLELSRTYIQLVREKTSSGSEEEKEIVLLTVYKVLMDTLKMMAPITPMITELIYQNFKEQFDLEGESIHLHEWPQHDSKLIDEDLEANYDYVKEVIQGILGARAKANIGVRWPVLEAIVQTDDDQFGKAIKRYSEAICSHTNVKSLKVVSEFKLATIKLKIDYKSLGPDFGADAPAIIGELTKESDSSILKKLSEGKLSVRTKGKVFILADKHFIKERSVPDNFKMAQISKGSVYIDTNSSHDLLSEGYARELIRRIQKLRKDQGMVKTDTINLIVQAEDELKDHLVGMEQYISSKVGAQAIKVTSNEAGKGYQAGETGSIKGLRFNLYFMKV